MANSPQAKKRARQNQKRQLQNASYRASVRTIVKKTLKILQSNDHSTIQGIFQKAIRLLDKAAGKQVVHPKKAARLKSRLSQRVKALKS
ncbi:30S ribosomal protein S20 [Coxiella endosymbiont of Dermacentor marginatus]|uniref:30S ribosomal protein S20 n=1 Tax=Coxiella endosymbiont of Dermacentor marginatus TaxID=1656159 RepID=UPI002221BA77|nr:30S ribosomal protein S20 [Coxiella endosymbiont of Dermacentor marginatus]